MRYNTNLLIISIFLSFFLLCSQAMGQEKNNSHGPDYTSINHQFFSRISLWNSLNIPPASNEHAFKGQDTGFSGHNRRLFNFLPSTHVTVQGISTQKIPMGTFSTGNKGLVNSSREKVQLSPYFLHSKVQNNSNLSAFWEEKLNSTPKDNKAGNIYWLGGKLSYSRFDHFSLQVNSLYGTNNLNRDKDYYTGWLTNVGLEYDLEKFTPILHMFYSTENRENQFPAKGNLLSLGLDQRDGFKRNLSGTSSSSGEKYGTTTEKNIGIQVGAKDLNLFNRLNNSFNLFYAKNIYSENIQNNNNTAELDYSKELSPNKIDAIWGVDLSSYYNLYENLSVGLYFSYTSAYPENREESENIDNSRIHSDLNFEF